MQTFNIVKLRVVTRLENSAENNVMTIRKYIDWWDITMFLCNERERKRIGDMIYERTVKWKVKNGTNNAILNCRKNNEEVLVQDGGEFFCEACVTSKTSNWQILSSKKNETLLLISSWSL